MSTLKTQTLTVLLTLLVGAGLMALWLHFRPLEIPRLARVDIGTLVAQQQQALVQRIEPGMSADDQGRLFDDAKAFGVRLDVALDQLAQECRCALINTAAVLNPSLTSKTHIPRFSGRVEL